MFSLYAISLSGLSFFLFFLLQTKWWTNGALHAISCLQLHLLGCVFYQFFFSCFSCDKDYCICVCTVSLSRKHNSYIWLEISPSLAMKGVTVTGIVCFLNLFSICMVVFMIKTFLRWIVTRNIVSFLGIFFFFLYFRNQKIFVCHKVCTLCQMTVLQYLTFFVGKVVFKTTQCVV